MWMGHKSGQQGSHLWLHPGCFASLTQRLYRDYAEVERRLDPRNIQGE
jgi:hypothetical protein